MISRFELTHARPDFGIATVRVGNRDVPVTEEVALDLPFGRLLHFAKDVDTPQPRVLVVAPLSGHFATLLRGTVETLLRDHDVYITDWANARDVPVEAGRFGVEDYVDYLIRFLEEIGPGAPHPRRLPALRAGARRRRGHVGGQQPGDAALDDADGRPDRLARKPDRGQRARHRRNRSPGSRTSVIARVPRRYAGGGRRVYPGLPAARSPSWR